MITRNFFSTSKTSSADWTRSFQTGSVRRSSNLAIWTLTACVFLLPVAFAHRTEAESSPSPTVLPAQNSSDSASSLEASSFSSPAADVATPALAPLTAIIAGETRKAHVLPTDDMTVGQALGKMGISLSALDRVSPDASEPFKAGMTVRVTRIKIELETRHESIPAGVRYQPSTKLAPGAKQTVQYSRAGTKEITEKVCSKDDKETLRKPVSSKVTRAPQPQIVALGVKSHLMPSNIKPSKRYSRALSYRGGSPRNRAVATGGKPGLLRVARTLKMNTTGYAAGRAGGAISNWTATGVRCTYGAIAVDPRVIPLGSKLYIEGYGYGFACDIGGAIKGNHIDLAFDSARAAMNHGRKRNVTVHVLTN